MYEKDYIIEKLKDYISKQLTSIMCGYNVTCQELGERIGKTKQVISTYNNKGCLPSLDALYMIASEFDVPITYFLPLKLDECENEDNIDISMLEAFKDKYCEDEEIYEPLYIKKLFVDNQDN